MNRSSVLPRWVSLAFAAVLFVAALSSVREARAIDACHVINPYEIGTLLQTTSVTVLSSDKDSVDVSSCVYQAAEGTYLTLQLSDTSGVYDAQLRMTPPGKFTETPLSRVGDNAVMWNSDQGVQVLARGGPKFVRIALMKQAGRDLVSTQQGIIELVRHVLAADWAVPVLPGKTPMRVFITGSAKPLQKVAPAYPPLAKQARIQGVVILRAVIGTDGRIESLQTISGHPMLMQAAMDAVKQWMYAPVLFDGHPVTVETEIKVHFMLSDKGETSVESGGTPN